MNIWRTSVAVAALTVAAGCGSEAPAAKPADAPKVEAKSKKASGTEAKSIEARADEIIADLKKREEEQLKIHEKATGRVPVVVEVSPTQGGGASAGAGRIVGPGIYPGSSAAAGINSADANYWRQEYSIASARLQSSQRRLEDAQRKMNEALLQGQSPNAALKKMAQEAYQRAAQEYSQAQNAFYEDQSAVNRARSAALMAGVPASALR